MYFQNHGIYLSISQLESATSFCVFPAAQPGASQSKTTQFFVCLV